MQKRFVSKPVYNGEYLKTKIKSYGSKINTDFHDNKVPKEDSLCISQSVLVIYSVYEINKTYYPQVFL